MVRRRTGPVDYEIAMKGRSKRYRVFHVNMLREWHSPDQVTCEAFEAIVEREDDISQCPVNSSGQSQVIVDEQLSAGQRNQLDDVVTRYSAVFCDDPGHTDIVEHQIDTGSARPVRQKPYRIPRSQEVVQKEIQKMMDMDVIQESRSDWASPIVLVPKRDGSMRFCVDYRELNKVSKFDAYPMPRIEDVIDQLGPARFISTLDLTRGYWQVPVSKDSMEKTAVITPGGL